MDSEAERRFERIEKTLEEHLPNVYAFIDELRTSHHEQEQRMKSLEDLARRLEDHDKRLIDIQADTAKILGGMNGKLKDHEERLSNGGL